MCDHPYQFEPLLPSEAGLGPLLAKAHDLSRIANPVASARVPPELRALLRSMNSYYTNRIEGQHTRPYEIDQALRKDFSTDEVLAAKQRLAVGHIDAEQALEQQYAGPDGAIALYSTNAVENIHRELFAKLPTGDLITPDGEPIVPGELRVREVMVGARLAPTHTSIHGFLERWATFYGGVRRGEAALVAVAAAHQRLGWVHPFVDGNGRVMRLHTHSVLNALGYTGGLWSPLRDFARNTERYYALLSSADVSRQGALDGRGNLSEATLVAWINYVLDTCIDQASFMASLLDFDSMKARIEACLVFEATVMKQGVRQESLRVVYVTCF